MRALTAFVCVMLVACQAGDSLSDGSSTVRGGPSAGPAATSGAIGPGDRPVTAERLVNSEAEPENWLMYSGGYESQRYSSLDQIDRGNVDELKVAWV